jgi:fermentation-respiration switch protein FrsA (DUF1100 family)
MARSTTLIVTVLVALVVAPVAASAAEPSKGERRGSAWRGEERISSKVVRRSVAFSSGRETLRGWLYLPRRRRGRVPGIVTANALSAVKEINLPRFAERFAAAGFAVVVFDYSYWGESSGTPRFHLAPIEHRRNISDALTFLARQPEVDPNRIGGFGQSMGGDNMLYEATWEPRFKAIAVASTGVSPATDDPPPSPEAARARRDELLAAAEAERAGRPTAGITRLQAWCPAPQPGCALPVREAYDWYLRAQRTFAPTWQNSLTSTSLANLQAGDPTFAINLARSPILIVQPDEDVVPVEDVLFWFRRAPGPKRMVIPDGLHISTYQDGEHFDLAADESIAWFERFLARW